MKDAPLSLRLDAIQALTEYEVSTGLCLTLGETCYFIYSYCKTHG